MSDNDTGILVAVLLMTTVTLIAIVLLIYILSRERKRLNGFLTILNKRYLSNFVEPSN
jgi:hypothetical protein